MNNFQNLWYRLTAPRSTSVDEARREYMTKVILAILILINTILFVPFLIGTFVGILPPINIGINFLIELFLIGIWWWADRGRWRVASYAAPVIFFILALWINYTSGIGSVAMLLYASVILLNTMLQQGRIQGITLAICIAAYLGVSWMHHQGFLPPIPGPEQKFAFFAIAVSGNLVFLAVLQRFYTSQFRRTLTELAEHKVGLEQTVNERTAAPARPILRQNQAGFLDLLGAFFALAAGLSVSTAGFGSARSRGNSLWLPGRKIDGRALRSIRALYIAWLEPATSAVA